MANAGESLGQQSAIAAALAQGVEILGVDQTVTFQKYAKFVSTIDGFVSWIATGQLITVNGSLHFATDRVQDEDQTIATNHVVLTALEPVTEFNTIAPGTMWLGAWPLGPAGVQPLVTLQIAFARRGNFYEPARLWHYSGFTVYPALQSQILNSADDLPVGPVVTNSLPIWLSLTTFAGLTVPVYASFLVPDNIVPPYIVAHIEPTATEVLQNFPLFLYPGPPKPDSPDLYVTSIQLARDSVKLILYGFTNQMAIQYLQMLIDYSNVGPGEPPTFGFASNPVIQDEKRTQVEIAALAMKKSIPFLANYYQSTDQATARRLILEAAVETWNVSNVA